MGEEPVVYNADHIIDTYWNLEKELRAVQGGSGVQEIGVFERVSIFYQGLARAAGKPGTNEVAREKYMTKLREDLPRVLVLSPKDVADFFVDRDNPRLVTPEIMSQKLADLEELVKKAQATGNARPKKVFATACATLWLFGGLQKTGMEEAVAAS